MKKVFCSALFLICLVSFSSLWAQKIYLKAVAPPGAFGGLVKGNVMARGHENEIEVLSYSNGVAGCVPNFGRQGEGACRTSVGALAFMMQFAEGVNPLRYFALNGERLRTADFVFEKPGREIGLVYYKIHMENVTVVSLQESGSGGEPPTFSIEFSASRIAWGVYRQNANGTTELASSVGFNLATNTPWTYAF